MNRRAFIAALPLIPAAAKAAMAEPDLYRCVITPNVKNYNLRSISWSTYLKQSDVRIICYGDLRGFFSAKLQRQLARPAPKLP